MKQILLFHMDHKYNAERHNNDNLLLLILKNSFTPIKAKKTFIKKNSLTKLTKKFSNFENFENF